jgi:transcriptional regulator with PAS, ATPase and Fis domain
VVSNTSLDSIYPLGGNTEFFTKGAVNAGTPAKIEPLKDFLHEQEVAYMNRILSQAGGDKEKAASLLGISLATLYRKLAGEEGV